MIIVMKRGASAADLSYVVSQVEAFGYKAHLSQGTERTIVGVVGDDRPLENHNFELLPGVEQIVRILQPFKLASRDFHPENTIVDVRGVHVGGEKVVIVAGPCSVESRSQLLETAWAVKEAGATILRARRVQAAQLPLLVPGHGRRGAGAAGRGARRGRSADHHRGDVHRAGAARLQIRGCPADRRAQHAELPAAPGGGTHAHPDHAQARADEHHSGMAVVVRLHPERRQSPGDAVRARHPHLRDGHAQHLRHQRHPADERPDASADSRRSEPRHRQVGSGGGGRAGRASRRAPTA